MTLLLLLLSVLQLYIKIACYCGEPMILQTFFFFFFFGAEKDLLQSHARRQVAHALKSLEFPEGF